MVGHKNKPILSKRSGKINHHAMKLRRNNIARDLKNFRPITEKQDTQYNRQNLKQNLKKDLDDLEEEE